jgi:hypothetical protein
MAVYTIDMVKTRLKSVALHPEYDAGGAKIRIFDNELD